MNIVVLPQVRRELRKAPKGVLNDVFALFNKLACGIKLSMPISRPLSSIAKGLHELRIPYQDGTYRIFYVIKMGDAIYILHGLKKKTQKLDKKTKEIILSRIRRLSHEKKECSNNL